MGRSMSLRGDTGTAQASCAAGSLELPGGKLAELDDGLLHARRPGLGAAEPDAVAIAPGCREQDTGPERNVVAQCLPEQVDRIAGFGQLDPEDEAAGRAGDARAGGKMPGYGGRNVGHLVAKDAAQRAQLLVISSR